MPSHKIERISSDISKYISQIIANETRDEFLKSITITGCKVSNDLGYAKVYFTSLLNRDILELEKEMNEAAKYIRGKLSGMIDIRHTPELHFVFDKSIEYGKRIESIIEKINES
jgi:ribosome-binding factor A